MTSVSEEIVIVLAIEDNVNGGVDVVGSAGRGSVSDWPSAAGAASMADASESDQVGRPSVEEVSVYKVTVPERSRSFIRRILDSGGDRFVAVRHDFFCLPRDQPLWSQTKPIKVENVRDKSVLGGGDVHSLASVVLSA